MDIPGHRKNHEEKNKKDRRQQQTQTRSLGLQGQEPQIDRDREIYVTVKSLSKYQKRQLCPGIDRARHT